MDIVSVISSGIPWALIIMVAVAVIGNVEWLKGLFKKAPTWAWSIVALAMCFGFIAAAVFVGEWVLYALVASSLMQLGYAVFIQGIPLLIKKAFGISDASAATGDVTPVATAAAEK